MSKRASTEPPPHQNKRVRTEMDTQTNMSWTFDELEVDEGISLHVNGKSVSAKDVMNMAGKDFELDVNDNVVSFANSLGGLQITLNNTLTQTISGPVHLNFSEMACCIGTKCLMWPPAPPKKPTTSVTGNIEEVIADEVELKVDGKLVSPSELKSYGGKSFTISANENEVLYTTNPNNSTTLVLNGTTTVTIDGPLHLNFSPMALCIGDKCLMWPPKKAEPKSSDEDFLATVKAKIGEQEYTRLSSLLKPVSSSHSVSSPSSSASSSASLGSQAAQKAEWEKILNENASKPMIVDLWAVWCAPCKKIAPHFEKFGHEFAKDAKFLSIDVQKNVYVKAKYKVDSLPCFLFIHNKNEVGRLVGDNISDLRTGIENFVKSKGATIGISGVPLTTQEVVIPKTEFDYIVIGGGSGGMASAKEAAKLGAHVALFDFVKPSTQKTTWGLGGTCVNVGCVPKKLMHYASLVGETIHHDAPAYGWEIPNGVKHDWATLVSTVQNHVKKLNFFYENGLHTANTKTYRNDKTEIISNGSVTYFNALGRLTDSNNVEYTDENNESRAIKGKYILISTGGRPFVPPPSAVPGALELAITSDDLFSLSHPPGRTLVVGAGYISLECSGFLRGLGYPVTIAVRSIPLRTGGFDRQCVNKVVQLMEMLGTRFLMSTDIRSLRKSDKGTIFVKFYKTNTKEPAEWEEEFDTVLYATGRGADAAGLNLAQVGVKTTSRGTVIADEADKTSVENIYAIGDVVDGRPELTPVAIAAGEKLARRLFAGSKQLLDYHNIPTTVFSPFEYGLVGYSEEAAIEKFGKDKIEVYLTEFTTLEIGAAHRHPNPPAGVEVPEDFPTNCLSKLVCLKENLKVVGAHFVGPNAGEITQGLAVCLRLGATLKDFTETIGIHPTDAESFTTLNVTKSSNEQWEQLGGCGGGKCG